MMVRTDAFCGGAPLSTVMPVVTCCSPVGVSAVGFAGCCVAARKMGALGSERAGG
jgi:hypothetical protein